MGTASRVGTMDPMGKTRIYTDETLREVPAGDPRAAFSWKRADLEQRRERRAELKLTVGDEALRAHIESREVERKKAEVRASVTQAEVDRIVDAIAESKRAEAAEAKAAAKSTKSKTDDAEASADA